MGGPGDTPQQRGQSALAKGVVTSDDKGKQPWHIGDSGWEQSLRAGLHKVGSSPWAGGGSQSLPVMVCGHL